jgi:hypothetical protein
MAESRMRIAIFHEGSSFQVRVSDYTGKDVKLLKEKLNLDDANDALLRMEEYEDLRSDEFFESGSGEGKALCFSCEKGRLVRLREFLDDNSGIEVVEGENLLPSTDDAKRATTLDDSFTEELEHIIESNLPFYRKGPAALVKGVGLRLGVLVLLLLVGRIFYLQRADHYVDRSLQAIMKSTEQTHAPQGFLSHFIEPKYTHRSKLKIKRPLYIRGNRVILEGGLYVMIEGIGNLKASIEAHNNEPVTIRVDTRSGEMKIVGLLVGKELVSPKGKLHYLGRMPVAGAPPSRVDALDTQARGAYVRVRDADPAEEATFSWMLGQTISVTANLEIDLDRYLIGTDDFRFAIQKSNVKPEIQEILDMAAAKGERAIVDMRLAPRAYPLRNRRNPREQRRDTNIVTTGNLHYITVQSAVLKNI